ncbi:MAG: hypothetical protein SGJ21_13520 [Alphaproteobacteria bacterium]|nr:hypothetical protein [Alphaproteobacteria bacterium]
MLPTKAVVAKKASLYVFMSADSLDAWLMRLPAIVSARLQVRVAAVFEGLVTVGREVIFRFSSKDKDHDPWRRGGRERRMVTNVASSANQTACCSKATLMMLG